MDEDTHRENIIHSSTGKRDESQEDPKTIMITGTEKKKKNKNQLGA
jgi:hypothetical protein